MGRYAGSIASIVVGVILIVAQQYPAGVALIVSGALGAIATAIFRPKTPSQELASAQELEISTSSPGFPVPVVFGKYRVTPNMMHYDKGTFETTEVRGDKPDGGKGGQKPKAPVIGFNYSLAYELGFCMGPIDAVGHAYQTPGDVPLRGPTSIKSEGTLTIDDLPQVGDTITVGSVTYTFVSAFTGANQLLVKKRSVVVNIIKNAINGAEGWKGIYYSSSITANPDVECLSPEYDAEQDLWTMVLRARTAGAAGDTIATTETFTGNSAFDGATLGTTTAGIDEFEYRTTFSGDYVDIDLSSEEESGTVRVYQGNATQTRVASGDAYQSLGMNYRNVCFGFYGVGGNYTMGRQPAPKSHSWIIYRLPKCIRDDGTTVSGIVTAGSATSGHVNEYAANPAAVVYESMVNKLWGGGLSSDYINEASFVTESEFFRDKNIGINFIVREQEELESYLDGLFQQLKMAVVWDGLQYKLKCFMNPATTHGTINTLRKSEIRNFSFGRTDWNTTVNEIRAEFIDEERNFRANLVEVKNAGNIAQQNGRISTNRIQLTVFTDYNTARRMAYRVLQDNAYPLGNCRFSVSRYKSQLEVGSVFRLIWDEFSTSTVTIYFQVVKMEADASDEEWIKIEAREDINIPAVAGEELSSTTPDAQAWELIDDIDVSNVQLQEQPALENAELIPIKAFEFPPIATVGQRTNVVLLAQKTSLSVISIQYLSSQRPVEITETTTSIPGRTYRRVFPAVPFAVRGQQASFAFSGVFKEDFTNLSRVNRSADGFEFQLNDPTRDETAMLAAFGQVSTVGDHLSKLTESEEDYCVAGEEMMHIGKITKLATNHYRATNILRGVFDSRVRSYEAGDELYLVAGSMHEGVDSPEKKAGELAYFRGYPIGTKGRVEPIGSSVQIYHSGKYLNTIDMDGRYMKWGIRPLPPTIFSVVDGGSTLTFTFRPRWVNRGGGVRGGFFEDQMRELQGSLDGLRFQYQFLDSALGELGTKAGRRKTFTLSEFVPGSLSESAAGLAVMEPITKATGGVRVLIWAELNGLASIDTVEYRV